LGLIILPGKVPNQIYFKLEAINLLEVWRIPWLVGGRDFKAIGFGVGIKVLGWGWQFSLFLILNFFLGNYLLLKV